MTRLLSIALVFCMIGCGTDQRPPEDGPIQEVPAFGGNGGSPSFGGSGALAEADDEPTPTSTQEYDFTDWTGDCYALQYVSTVERCLEQNECQVEGLGGAGAIKLCALQRDRDN